MKKLIFLSIVFTIQSSTLWACFCAPIPTFCESITTGNNGEIYEEYTIIRASVISKETTGITVKKEGVLFGETNLEEIFINRGSSSFCTINTDIFSEGEIYIFSIWELDSNQDNYLSDCGIHFLKIENGIVTGPIAPNIESISLDEIMTIQCFEDFTLSASDANSLENSISIFPNPNDGNFYILNLSEIQTNQIIKMELMDTQGRIIYRNQKTDGWLPNDEWRINVNEIAKGVYFLRIFVEEKSMVLRIVKM